MDMSDDNMMGAGDDIDTEEDTEDEVADGMDDMPETGEEEEEM